MVRAIAERSAAASLRAGSPGGMFGLACAVAVRLVWGQMRTDTGRSARIAVIPDMIGELGRSIVLTHYT